MKKIFLLPFTGATLTVHAQNFVWTSQNSGVGVVLNDVYFTDNQNGWTEAGGIHGIGLMYLAAVDTMNATEYFRRAYELDPERKYSLLRLSECQIRSNVNIEQCLSLSNPGMEKWPEICIFSG